MDTTSSQVVGELRDVAAPSVRFVAMALQAISASSSSSSGSMGLGSSLSSLNDGTQKLSSSTFARSGTSERGMVASSPAASTASSTASTSSNLDSAIGASPISLSASPSPSSSQHPPNGQHSSARGTRDSFSSSRSSPPPTSIRAAFAIVERLISSSSNQTELPVVDINIVDIPIENLAAELTNISQSVCGSFAGTEHQIGEVRAPGVVLVTTSDDIRQTLYPLFAGAEALAAIKFAPLEKSESDASNIRHKMPELFRCFVPVTPQSLGSDTASSEMEIESASCVAECLERRLQSVIKTIAQENLELLVRRMEKINQSYTSAVCCDTYVDSSLIVRARGLPWQASDQDIAFFFVGLNIAPGGIALCLSAEGRRNGEALVRFESSKQRELALRRNRKFLHSRYIEVYRGTGEEFMKVAVGELFCQFYNQFLKVINN